MQSEKKQCQNCHNEFTIEPDDFDFYEKIKVPLPTWCPECRLLRRLLWRNEKTLYKRPDSRTGELIFSAYPPNAPIKVWERDYWFSDKWDDTVFGRDYDWKKNFFDQIRELMLSVPWHSRSVLNIVRSDYCINAGDLKDCYLVFGTSYAENCYYCANLYRGQELFDCSYTNESQIGYQNFFNTKCYRAFFSSFCENSRDIYFCKDCTNISNCVGCVGLKNKSYYIFNQPYKERVYKIIVNDFHMDSYKGLSALKEKVKKHWIKYPVRYMYGTHNTEVSGEYIRNSKNVKKSYQVTGGENIKYCQNLLIPTSRDSYDHYRFGQNSELVYESTVCGYNISQLRFCYECWPDSVDLTYCLNCHSSSHLFGCVGLKKAQYRILNKQYTKEEYEALVPKIIKHINDMQYVDKKGRVYKYGEFFPPEFSPFAYNETIVQEYFPLTKEQALSQGYRWHDSEEKNIEITKKPEDLPDNIKDVNNSIINEVIGCSHQGKCNEQCTLAFKIISQELQFYQSMNLPLPRLCPNCRHAERISQRAGFSMWKRKCTCAGVKSDSSNSSGQAIVYQNTAQHFHGQDHCPNEFETSYAPDRPEIVYCEQCYNSEVV